MALIVVCSAAGAPGATTTALGWSMTWPGDVLLVDADRVPAQAVLAGYLRGRAPASQGLGALLQAHRERRPMADEIERQSLPLPVPPPGKGEAEVRRRFLPGFPHLGSVDLFAGAWREFAATLRERPGDTIVDAGRIGIHGLPADLVDAAQRIVVVCRSSLASLAALRLYLGLITDQVPDDRVGLALVGAGQPYTAAEAAGQFGVPVWAELPWDARGAAELGSGDTLRANWRRRGLGAAYTATAASLRASLVAPAAEAVAS